MDVPPSMIPMFIVGYGTLKKGLGVFLSSCSKSIMRLRNFTAFLFELFPSIGVLEWVVTPLKVKMYSMRPLEPIIGIRSVGSATITCGGNFVPASTKSFTPPNIISSSYVQYTASPF